MSAMRTNSTANLSVPLRHPMLAGIGGTMLVNLLGTAAGAWIGHTWPTFDFPGFMGLVFWGAMVLAVVAATGLSGVWPDLSPRNYWRWTLLLCSLVAGSSITAAPFHPDADGYLGFFRLAGFLPKSDAAGYYQTVLDWPEDTLSVHSSRRPLSALMNILAFHAGGRTLFGYHFIKACLLATVVAAFIRALSHHAGRAAAWTAGGV